MDTQQLGPWTFSAADFSIADTTQRIELEPLLCKLLQLFAQNPGKIISRQQLIDEIWQQSFVDDNAINRAISELRKALQHPSLAQSPIKTHHRKGYSLQLGNHSKQPLSSSDAITASAMAAQTGTATTQSRQQFRYALLTAMLLTAAAVFYWLSNTVADKPSTDIPKATTSGDKAVTEQQLVVSSQQKVTWFKGVESRPLLSPDKKLLAYGHSMADGSMRVMVRKAFLPVTSQPLQDIALEDSNYYILPHSWQPASSNLLVQAVSRDAKQCQYQLYDFSQYPQYQVTTLAQCSGFTIGNAQLSLDGQLLYFSAGDGGIYTSNALQVENLITGTRQTLVAAPANGLGTTIMTLSPDGQQLAYLYMPESGQPEVFIYSVNTREQRRIASLPLRTLLFSMEWSQDQSTLYIPSGDAILQLDVASKALNVLTTPKNTVIGELSMLTANSAFISGLSTKAISQNVMQLVKVTQPFNDAERRFTPLHDAEGSALDPEFSPVQAKQYSFAANWSGSWQLWLNDNGQPKPLTEFSDTDTPVNSISWSDDGRYIAFIRKGNVYLYDMQRQQLLTKLNDNDAGQAVWMPDNSGLVYSRIYDEQQNLWQLDLVSGETTQLTFAGAGQAQFDDNGQLYYVRDGRLIRYVDGLRGDTEVLSADNSAEYMGISQLQHNTQWRFGMLGHLQQRSLTGEVLQQTQLPYQLLGINFNPHNADELYLTVYINPELALEYIEWEVASTK